MKLKMASNNAMISLDENPSYFFQIPELFKGKDFEWEFKREVFEKSNKNRFEEILNPVIDAIQNAKILKSDLNEVVLIGGASKIPKIKEILSDYFEGIEIVHAKNPQNYVVKGAAIQGAMLESTIEKKEIPKPDLVAEKSTTNATTGRRKAPEPVIAPTKTQEEVENVVKLEKVEKVEKVEKKTEKKDSGCIIS
jgi:molecular chaperone DnaK (HSP70)